MQNKTFEEIKENKLFAGIDPSYISKIKIDQKKFLSYKEGCIIYRINDESNCLFLVVEGEVKLKNYNYVPGGSNEAAVKIKNDFFGEKEAIYRSPRSSAAVANRDCLLYVWSINDLPKYLIRKLYYLNNAYFPEQEYFPKDKNPDADDLEKEKIRGMAKPMFLRVKTLGRMEYYRKLHEMPAAGKIINNERFAIIENDIELPEKKSGRDELNNPDYQTGSLHSNEPYKASNIDAEIFTCLKKAEDSADDDVLNSWVKRTAETFIKIGLSGGRIDSLLSESANLLQCLKCDLFIADTLNNELIRWDPLKKSEVKFKIGLALTGAAAERKEILYSNDVRCEPNFIPEYEGTEGIEINSMLCFPLLNNENNLLAVLRFINKFDGKFGIEEKKYLNLLSPFFSSFIANQMTQGDVKENNYSGISEIVSRIKDDLRENFFIIKRCGNALAKMNLESGVINIPEIIYAEADFAEEYLSALEQFTKGSLSPEMRNEEITGILNNSLNVLAGFAGSKNVRLLKKISAGGYILTDKKKFRQVCFYIIKNLCRAMPGGGKIYIKTESEDGIIKVQFKDCPDFIRQFPANIFESDSSGNNDHGLELSFTRAVVNGFGGFLEINDLSQEASVIITLPLNENLTANRQIK